MQEIYGELTKKDGEESGGKASLTILDRDKPFVDGNQDEQLAANIVFDFKPPMKQYDFDFSSRSGGEKAMAGLALIFALAVSARPRPHFVLLDEVDAHLDAANTQLLERFLARQKPIMLTPSHEADKGKLPQVLIISHKEQAIGSCHSLVGVTQQEFYSAPEAEKGGHKCISACTYSLDLRQYAQ